MTEATPPGYVLKAANRIDKRGGGLSIICQEQYKPILQNTLNNNSFGCAEWLIRNQSTKLLIILIYRPPYSNNNRVTIATFLNVFTEYLASIIHKPIKILIAHISYI